MLPRNFMNQQTNQEQPKIMDLKDIADNKLFAAIGYLGILCFVPLFLKKDSLYAQFHGRQALVLFIAEIIVSFVNIIPFLGQLIWFFGSIVFLIVSVMGIIKAWQGECWEIPLISGYARKISL